MENQFSLVSIVLFLSAVCAVIVNGQRAPFAGKRPNGYKDRFTSTEATAVTNENGTIVDRFGDNDLNVSSTTTQPLPHQALGDIELINQLNRLPIEQRPFWLINYQAIEAQKNGGIVPTTTLRTTTVDIGVRIDDSESTTIAPNRQEIVYSLEHPNYAAAQLQKQQQLLQQKQQDSFKTAIPTNTIISLPKESTTTLDQQKN